MGGNDTAGYCKEGYRGTYCSICEPGYFRLGSASCALCVVTTTNIIIAIAVLVIGLVGDLGGKEVSRGGGDDDDTRGREGNQHEGQLVTRGAGRENSTSVPQALISALPLV